MKLFWQAFGPLICYFLGLFIGSRIERAKFRARLLESARRAGNPKRAKAQNLIRLVTFPYKRGGPPSRANEWEKGNNSIDEDN